MSTKIKVVLANSIMSNLMVNIMKPALSVAVQGLKHGQHTKVFVDTAQLYTVSAMCFTLLSKRKLC